MKEEIAFIMKEHEILKEEKITTSQELIEAEMKEERLQRLLNHSKTEVKRLMQQLIDFDVIQN
jgi:predicted transcriptional regulator